MHKKSIENIGLGLLCLSKYSDKEEPLLSEIGGYLHVCYFDGTKFEVSDKDKQILTTLGWKYRGDYENSWTVNVEN